MKLSQSYIRTIIISLPIVIIAATGCASQDPANEPDFDNSPVLRISADIDHNSQARAYQAQGTVVDGIFNLSYPTTTNNDYNIGEVRFGVTTENPQIGYVTLPGDLPLKWLSVGGGSTPTLYLDNIPRRLAGATNDTEITFTADNPYVAAPFDSIEGTNDLLWSAQMFQRNAGTLHFDLQHAMARARLMITADNTNGEIDLTGATVKITNLNCTPGSFNRLEGTLALNTEDNDAFTDLVFVDSENNLDWINTYEPADNMKVYQSPDFVLPPQDLLTDDRRPQLVITLANGVTYSGILPSAMLISDGTYNEPSYPVALSFLSQYVLTIRTVITDEPPSLNFMPVYVTRWVDKGTFEEEAHQCGIYTAAEFYKLIDYYVKGNVFQLDRYGKQREVDNGKMWYFDFWSSVVLDYNLIKGKMPVNTKGGPFTFIFNNFGVYVQYGSAEDEPVAVTPQTLYNIVTGTGN